MTCLREVISKQKSNSNQAIQRKRSPQSWNLKCAMYWSVLKKNRSSRGRWHYNWSHQSKQRNRNSLANSNIPEGMEGEEGTWRLVVCSDNPTVIPIWKKNGSKRACNTYRWISLLSHVGKMYICQILEQRARHKVEQLLNETQMGFRRGRGCTELQMPSSL